MPQDLGQLRLVRRREDPTIELDDLLLLLQRGQGQENMGAVDVGFGQVSQRPYEESLHEVLLLTNHAFYLNVFVN